MPFLILPSLLLSRGETDCCLSAALAELLHTAALASYYYLYAMHEMKFHQMIDCPCEQLNRRMDLKPALFGRAGLEFERAGFSSSQAKAKPRKYFEPSLPSFLRLLLLYVTLRICSRDKVVCSLVLQYAASVVGVEDGSST